MAAIDDVWVDTALGRLRIRTGGTGEAIMFWPSLLMTGDMWAAQAQHFSPQRRGRRVILVDPPGHGGSESSRRHSLSRTALAASSTSSTAWGPSARISSATRGAG